MDSRRRAEKAPRLCFWIKFGPSSRSQYPTKASDAMAEAIKKLPVKGAWQVYVHKLRAYVMGDDGSPVRPHLMLVISTKDGQFLACEPASGDDEAGGGNVVKDRPTPEALLDFLKKVMTHPRVMNTTAAGEKRKAARPESIRFADTHTASLHLGEKDKWAGETACPYVEGCRAGLAECGVDDVGFAPVPPDLIESIIRTQIEPSMAPDNQEWGTQHLPGLSQSVDGFTDAFGGSLFAAAAEFARVSPWTALTKRRPVQISYRLVLREDVAMRLTAYVSVVGSKEEGSFGFAVHKTLDEAKRAYEVEVRGDAAGDDVESSGESVNGQSCMFASVYETPFEDVDDAERAGWDLAPMEDEPGEYYWPIFCKMTFEKGEDGTEDALSLTRPAIVELQCFELALKAVVALIKSGELRRADDENQSANDGKPWTVQCETFAGSAGSETATIDVEVSLPSLDDSAANEGQDAYL